VTEQPPVVLTDEELAILAGNASPVVLPRLDDLRAGHREIAMLTAYRGLVARGWVTPAGTQATKGSNEVPVEMAEELADLLQLRASADTVVCARRTIAEGLSFRYWHLGDGVALDERVSASGFHEFGLTDPAAVGDELARWALDPEAVGESGPERVIDPEAAASGRAPSDLIEQLARARLVADVVVRRMSDERPGEMLGVLSGPEGVYVMTGRFGGTEAVRVRSVVPAEAQGILAELVNSPRGP
jgi:hypothetical protein